jgi:hypothetical protein
MTDQEELFGQLKVRHRSSPYAHRHGRATTWIGLSVSRRKTAAEAGSETRKSTPDDTPLTAGDTVHIHCPGPVRPVQRADHTRA